MLDAPPLAPMYPTLIAAYLVLFATVGFLFIFVALLIGWFLRGRAPTPEKREIYECGEPAIGSSFVQFDLRFYVVALVFIIFDVEVAFFFPWATVFGKATQLVDIERPIKAVDGQVAGAEAVEKRGMLVQAGQQKHRELTGMKALPYPYPPNAWTNAEREGARNLARMAIADISVFFGVLLVGFAYVWYRGDLNWVRAMTPEPAEAIVEAEEETAVVGT
jgi:NADH-quinone oxidoreductase subunit A